MRLSRKLLTVMLVSSMAMLAAACSGSDDPVDTPTPEPTTGPFQVTEEIVAASTDGVLFDIKLGGSLFDHDDDNSFRDAIEFLSPGSVEFQGHFPAPDGDLVIASCFASECQTAERSATFSVRYWSE